MHQVGQGHSEIIGRMIEENPVLLAPSEPTNAGHSCVTKQSVYALVVELALSYTISSSLVSHSLALLIGTLNKGGWFGCQDIVIFTVTKK
jgi:ABC-type antimicrobial peptide transport system ATPase subunit